jgi:hypothetical protein
MLPRTSLVSGPVPDHVAEQMTADAAGSAAGLVLLLEYVRQVVSVGAFPAAGGPRRSRYGPEWATLMVSVEEACLHASGG